MNRQEHAGVGFGFTLVLIWLVLLTGFIMYDKMVEDREVGKTIMLPPQLEVIEIEGVDYDLQSNT
jgi:hypothetical protein